MVLLCTTKIILEKLKTWWTMSWESCIVRWILILRGHHPLASCVTTRNGLLYQAEIDSSSLELPWPCGAVSGSKVSALWNGGHVTAFRTLSLEVSCSSASGISSSETLSVAALQGGVWPFQLKQIAALMADNVIILVTYFLAIVKPGRNDRRKLDNKCK